MKRIYAISAFVLSMIMLLSVVGCGGNKKNEQALTKTTTTQEVKQEAPKEKKTALVLK